METEVTKLIQTAAYNNNKLVTHVSKGDNDKAIKTIYDEINGYNRTIRHNQDNYPR